MKAPRAEEEAGARSSFKVTALKQSSLVHRRTPRPLITDSLLLGAVSRELPGWNSSGVSICVLCRAWVCQDPESVIAFLACSQKYEPPLLVLWVPSFSLSLSLSYACVGTCMHDVWVNRDV